LRKGKFTLLKHANTFQQSEIVSEETEKVIVKDTVVDYKPSLGCCINATAK
jgi:hypothetical protein